MVKIVQNMNMNIYMEKEVEEGKNIILMGHKNLKVNI